MHQRKPKLDHTQRVPSDHTLIILSSSMLEMMYRRYWLVRLKPPSPGIKTKAFSLPNVPSYFSTGQVIDHSPPLLYLSYTVVDHPCISE